MPNFDWDKATPRERDAEVAKALGRPFRLPTHGTCCTCQICGGPNDEDCLCGVSTDDGIAFKYVWPEVLKHSKNMLLGLGDSSIPWNFGILEIQSAEGNVVELEYYSQGDTNAEVICKAFLKLKEVLG